MFSWIGACQLTCAGTRGQWGTATSTARHVARATEIGVCRGVCVVVFSGVCRRVCVTKRKSTGQLQSLL
ncbi:hypothetical protein, conserved in T. vivax [Trypanosoma vivax Y486]|uniref:Uncharacterized protein n=1 Tax=Trypanosoma vivax (strain Y486) TaxID=1055687 RepID=F9WUA4_TRYVY|nr:hypothetical protein, conserved in T. vivax [Trypanosoma vivax Y486]|eukprot:CCD21152.1 hypothetical protein, conserved in T. vivax [Trypanosoma vivax Y486]